MTALLLLLLMAESCVVVRNPSQHMYVHKSNVNLESPVHADIITLQQIRQVLPKAQSLKSKNFLFFRYIKQPEKLDSALLAANLERVLFRLVNMGYLNARGYYTIHHQGELSRKVTYHIDPGSIFIVTSVTPYLNDAYQDSLFHTFYKKNGIRLGTPFHYERLQEQLQALQYFYNENGYVRMHKEQFSVVVDTLQVAFDGLSRRYSKKPWSSLQLSYVLDTTQPVVRYNRYRIGNVYVRNNLYNEQKDAYQQIDKRGIFYQDRNKQFRDKYIIRQLTFSPLEQYKRSNILNTQANFYGGKSFSKVWYSHQYTNDTTVDLYYDLTKNKRMSFGLYGDLRYNDGTQIISQAGQGQLLDLSVTTEATFNNLFRSSVQYSLFFRAGLQFTPSLALPNVAQSFTISNRIRIPGFWVFGFYINTKHLEQPITMLSIDGRYINRTELFSVYSFIFSPSYQWRSKQSVFRFSPINLEFYYFNRGANFDTYLKNTYYEYQATYQDGRLLSMLMSFAKTWQISRNTTLSLSANVEESGIYGSIYNAIATNDTIPLFFRHEVDLRLKKDFNSKSVLVLRVHYGNNVLYDRQYVTPYFRKFFAGGAYTMRAWEYKTLGPGSAIGENVSPSVRYEQIGDLKIEANLEYRFKLFDFFSFETEGAIFSDIGNIWIKDDRNNYGPNGIFSFERFSEDIAIAVGFGVRFKINFLVLRLDWAYRMKDPQQPGRFFPINNAWDGTLQIGVGYPF